jgi:glycosyltransferase involved in cell wall biosynthesis
MRIGMIASPWIAVPPPAYGGTETVIHNLCVGLRHRGHEVHLVTVTESTCPVLCSAVFEQSPTVIGDPISEIVQARAAYALFQDVDVIHDHTTVGPQFLPETVAGKVPVVTTVHGPFTLTTRLMYANRPDNLSVIAISHAQRAMAPEIDVAAVVHHGIDTDLHQPGPGRGGYLVFVGRMSPDKGPDRAIEVAQRVGIPLVLAAKMREQDEIAYFEQRVKPKLGPDVTFIGEADTGTRLDLLQHAEAMVNPICWPEPFGLVMAEALACGTPVIALGYGAAPEIVDHEVTGFVCDDLDAMVAAVGRLDEIDRAECRAVAVDRFSVARMASDHEALYEHVVSPWESASLAKDVALPGAPGRAVDDGEAAVMRTTADEVVTPFDPARKRAHRPCVRPRTVEGLGTGG